MRSSDSNSTKGTLKTALFRMTNRKNYIVLNILKNWGSHSLYQIIRLFPSVIFFSSLTLCCAQTHASLPLWSNDASRALGETTTLPPYQRGANYVFSNARVFVFVMDMFQKTPGEPLQTTAFRDPRTLATL